MPQATKTPAPAGKKPRAVKANSHLTIVSVMLFAEIRALSQPARITRFGECATVSQRAFAEMGKLRRAIEADLKDGQDFTNTMRSLGIRDGTISNTSYAARVFDLVQAGHVTEKQYDTFSFQDCLSIVRVMGPQSKCRLAGPEIAVVLSQAPDNFDREFQCITDHGVCLADKAKADQIAADAAKAIADKAALEALNPLAPAPAVPPAASAPAPGAAPVVVPITPTADASVPPPAAIEPGVPDNIIPGPGAPAPATVKPAASKLGQLMNLIDTLELLFADVSVEEARKAAPRLMELADTVVNYCAEPAAPGESAKPVKAKQKAA